MPIDGAIGRGGASRLLPPRLLPCEKLKGRSETYERAIFGQKLAHRSRLMKNSAAFAN